MDNAEAQETYSTRTRAASQGIRELMVLPFLMGGLSLLMWFSLPTDQAVRDHYAGEIEQREMQLRRIAADLPVDGRARAQRCHAILNPLPARYSLYLSAFSRASEEYFQVYPSVSLI